MHHADDARRPFVAAALEIEAIDGVLLRGGADELHRPAVRHVGEQCAEGEHHRDVELLGDADQLLGEQPPTQRRLRAEHQDHVAARGAGAPRTDRGPHDGASLLGREPYMRPHGGEVGELLRVDLGEGLRLPRFDEVPHAVAGCIGRIVPAGEGRNQDGALQRGLRQPADVLHGPSRYRHRRGAAWPKRSTPVARR